MKINIKTKKGNYTVDFLITPMRDDNGLVAMAKDSKQLDILNQAALDLYDSTDELIGRIVAKVLENKLKLPIEQDRYYAGAGYGFKFDMYSIAKKLK